jgi:hypothetical protein
VAATLDYNQTGPVAQPPPRGVHVSDASLEHRRGSGVYASLDLASPVPTAAFDDVHVAHKGRNDLTADHSRGAGKCHGRPAAVGSAAVIHSAHLSIPLQVSSLLLIRRYQHRMPRLMSGVESPSSWQRCSVGMARTLFWTTGRLRRPPTPVRRGLCVPTTGGCHRVASSSGVAQAGYGWRIM